MQSKWRKVTSPKKPLNVVWLIRVTVTASLSCNKQSRVLDKKKELTGVELGEGKFYIILSGNHNVEHFLLLFSRHWGYTSLQILMSLLYVIHTVSFPLPELTFAAHFIYSTVSQCFVLNSAFLFNFHVFFSLFLNLFLLSGSKVDLNSWLDEPTINANVMQLGRSFSNTVAIGATFPVTQSGKKKYIVVAWPTQSLLSEGQHCPALG